MIVGLKAEEQLKSILEGESLTRKIYACQVEEKTGKKDFRGYRNRRKNKI